jgi:hypothetical protein
MLAREILYFGSNEIQNWSETILTNRAADATVRLSKNGTTRE